MRKNEIRKKIIRLELERLSREWESNRSGGKGGEANQEGSVRVGFGGERPL